jgi:hypothetical protein
MVLKPKAELPPGSDTKCTEWKCFNRLRTGVGCSKDTLDKWGYLDNSQDLKCRCDTPTNNAPFALKCPLLEQVCTAEHLAAYNGIAQKCVQLWLCMIKCVDSQLKKRMSI